MPDKYALSHGALQEGRFFGRDREMERLRRMARDLSRGWGRSVHLWAPPGTGKTELLRQFASLLFKEGEIFPFIYSFPRLEWGLRDFAADFAAAFIAQYMAFRKKDVSLLVDPPSSDVLLQVLQNDESGAGRFLAEKYRFFSNFSSSRSPSIEAGLLPRRFAEHCGCNVLVILDDFSNLSGYRPAELASWSREALLARQAPLLIAGRNPSHFDGIFANHELAGALESWELPSLSENGADGLLRSLLRAAGVEVEAGLRRTLIRQAGRSPYYLEAIVRELETEGTIDGATVQRAYAAALCRSGIHRYWLHILNASLPSLALRRSALEVLVFCLREESTRLDVGQLSSRMLKDRAEVEQVLDALGRAGILHVDCARVTIMPDPVLKDFVGSFYRQETGTHKDFVEAALAADKVGGVEADEKNAARRSSRRQLKALFEVWSGQEIPKALFQAGEFRSRYAQLGEEEVAAGLAEEKEKLVLPAVVSVASGLIGAEKDLPVLDADAVAWVFQAVPAAAPGPTCWIVKVVREGTVEEETVADFDRRVDAVQAGGELLPPKLVKWLIAGRGGFSPEASALAARHRILTSTVFQVRLLGRLLGVETDEICALHAPEEDAGIRLEFEMSIPMVSETELVAARALEQLAENMNFTAAEIGKIKMALVEACINAFEHSGLPEGKVKIFFSVAGDSLIVRVENRGRRFAPDRIPAVSESPELKKRGWGLNLIRELMDEVEFEPLDDGVSLVMVKHLKGKETTSE